MKFLISKWRKTVLEIYIFKFYLILEVSKIPSISLKAFCVVYTYIKNIFLFNKFLQNRNIFFQEHFRSNIIKSVFGVVSS